MLTLRADGLVLEPLTVAHAPALFALLADPELHRYIDSGPPPSLESLVERYARLERRISPDGSQRWLNWIVRPHAGEPIGYVQATIVPADTSWIAYLLGRAHQGRGLARVATRAMVDHLVADHGVRTLLATVEVDNLRSIALLEALAFEPATDDDSASHDLTASERLFVRGPRPARASRRPT